MELPTEVAVRLARIEEKLDQHLRRGDDQESRIRALEQFKWISIGAALAAGGAAGAAVNALGLG